MDCPDLKLNLQKGIIMANPSKYKSIGVSTEAYEKLLLIAANHRRNLSQQLSLLIDLELETLTAPDKNSAYEC